VEVYHSTEYGLQLKGMLAGHEVLTETLLPEFALVIGELFAARIAPEDFLHGLRVNVVRDFGQSTRAGLFPPRRWPSKNFFVSVTRNPRRTFHGKTVSARADGRNAICANAVLRNQPQNNSDSNSRSNHPRRANRHAKFGPTVWITEPGRSR